ncbi:response regulator [Luteirhabdus pelagi]|uniref:response regulator n=1 Tax=Luteirhabdus pelagi TaxID=2792783 RepID=UPI0019397AEE|nr:response regulator [Luteirhabdus pelagi]
MKLLAFFIPLLVFLQFKGAQPEATGGNANVSLPQDSYTEESFQRLIDSSRTLQLSGSFQEALDLDVLILDEALASQNPLWIHKGYRRIAHDYLANDNFEQAREVLDKSMKYAKLANNTSAKGYAWLDYGNFFMLKGALEKGLQNTETALRLFETIEDSTAQAQAHVALLSIASEKDNLNDMYFHLFRAKRLHENAAPDALKVTLDQKAADYYYRRGDLESSFSYMKLAIETAEQLGFSTLLQPLYDTYGNRLYEAGRFQQAYDILRQHERLKDKLFEQQRQKINPNFSNEFQLAEYKEDIEAAETRSRLQAEIVENKSRLNNFLFMVSGCFLILLIFLLVLVRNRKRLIRELKLRNAKYLIAKERSEKLAKTKSNFFSTVSHELRTPLYGVIGLSSILLEDKNLQQEHKEDLESLKFSADYLLALINDVLQINKIDSNNVEDEDTVFVLRNLIHSIASSFEYMRQQNRNLFHFHIDESIPAQLKGNAVRLSQILMNLIGNACKFTEKGDIYITVEVLRLQDETVDLQFSIKDTGIGISKDKHQHIFEEFSQVDSHKYTYQGTGLGLPITRKLLYLSGSELKLESELGKGATFSFDLTYAIVSEEEMKAHHTEIDVSSLRGKTVLVVEDNRINQTVTRKLLEKYEMQCRFAENGREAVARMQQHSYDIVLMDINMPVMNGIEATKEIRKFDTTTPIIALTAVEVAEMRKDIYDSGMEDIIVKPYDPKKFVQKILNHLRKNPSSIPESSTSEE